MGRESATARGHGLIASYRATPTSVQWTSLNLWPSPGQPPDGSGRVKRFPLVRGPATASQRPAAAARSAFTRSDSARFVAIDAAMTPMVTIAIMMVQTALISGFTPSRTDE